MARGIWADSVALFDNAIQGWELTIEFWDSKLQNADDPLEPNINNCLALIDYAGDALKTDVYGDSFIVEYYRGKKSYST